MQAKKERVEVEKRLEEQVRKLTDIEAEQVEKIAELTLQVADAGEQSRDFQERIESMEKSAKELTERNVRDITEL